MGDRPLFILAGNGPYLNRGCEAIVRGTVNIIRHHFANPRFLCISHYNYEGEFEEERTNEIDDGILHQSAYRVNKRSALSNFYKPRVWRYVFRSIARREKLGYSIYGDMLPYLPEAKAVLSIGGDNYSLDYGIPYRFTSLDDLSLREKKPLVIWGASVGPFSTMPQYENYMAQHLRHVNRIFARETETENYLRRIGVKENVVSVADPAFMMEPIATNKIDNIDVNKSDSIGVNLSPLLAKYITNGDVQLWSRIASKIIKKLAIEVRRPIFLIPHVTIPFGNDDYVFMENALNMAGNPRDVYLTPRNLNAAETKWLIGKMSVFCGARTHATIASLSMEVPTISLAYSNKARGINRDIFGNRSYVVEPKKVKPDEILSEIKTLCETSDDVKSVLKERIPNIRKKANDAGTVLKSILED